MKVRGLRGDVPGKLKAPEGGTPPEEPPNKYTSDDAMIQMLEEALQGYSDTVGKLEETFRRQVAEPQNDFGAYLMQLYKPDYIQARSLFGRRSRA